MGTDSSIPYVHHTWGPWRGCTPVSPGCDNCYMFREQLRYGNDPTEVVRCSKAIWRQPLSRGVRRWRSRARVMVCSWSDFFHPAADGWRDEATRVIMARPDLWWIIPTKRVERIALWLDTLPLDFDFYGLTILASVENQAAADKRIPKLIEVKRRWPSLRTGASVEPLIGHVVLRELSGLDWVIIGAENAAADKVRYCPARWVHDIVCDCRADEVPCYVKQVHGDDGRLIKMPAGWPREYPEYIGDQPQREQRNFDRITG